MINDGVHRSEIARVQRENLARENEAQQKKAQLYKAKMDQETTRCESGRWQFRFREMNADDAGRDGRQRGAVGRRYGLPLPDRKKGQIKIPTRVRD